MTARCAAALLLALCLAWLPRAAAAAPRTLTVGPTGAYPSIAAALAAADVGDTVLVQGGVHPGPVLVHRSVRLVGAAGAVLDGGGSGTVVQVAAPGTEVSGFTIRNTGRSLNGEDSGVRVTAAGARISGNRLEGVLFGIYLLSAPDSVVQGNTIAHLDLGLSLVGDSIRLWESGGSRVEGNRVRGARQLIVQHSDGAVIAGNQIEHGLYGIHVMRSDNVTITDNRLRHNSVGMYGMYSLNLTVRGNLVSHSQGPSGYALGLKDMENCTIVGNWLVNNRVGIYLDNSPRMGSGEQNWLEGNLVAGNHRGLLLLPNAAGNRFAGNTFANNLEQVEIAGGGGAADNLWAPDGRGNYWSDYSGFDADGDGIGDLPHAPRSLAEALIDRQPVLRWFLASPALSALELAGRIVPDLAPRPKLSDGAPAMGPTVPAPPGELARPPAPVGRPLALLALALALLAPLLLPLRTRWEATRRDPGAPPDQTLRLGHRPG